MADCVLVLFLVFSGLGFLFMPGFALDRGEEEAVYSVLEGINPGIPWRTLFPDDLCTEAPHGVVCDYFTQTTPAGEAVTVPHVIELSFGYVSDYSPNPPCGPNPNFDPVLLLPLTHLRKLFFYQCFTELQFSFPDFSSFSTLNRSSSLEELVFIENPLLVGTLDGKIGKLGNLRRFVLTGSSVSIFGGITSNTFAELSNLEQLTLSRNRLKGQITGSSFQSLKKLKILDLSSNEFQGGVPDSIGDLTELLKLDLSNNGFSGRIPGGLRSLKGLEFLDLSYNMFGNYGIPLILSEMVNLKEVYLSGNFLGGVIPEVWENLGGLRGLGMSKMGLVGNIPKSMGVHLTSVSYILLDNNRLEGSVPEEFGGLGFLNELNLENNSLSGRLPFSSGFVSRLGGKLKVEGNLDICIDEGVMGSSVKMDSHGMKLKACSSSSRQPGIPQTALFHENSCPGFFIIISWQFVGFLLFWALAASFPLFK